MGDSKNVGCWDALRNTYKMQVPLDIRRGAHSCSRCEKDFLVKVKLSLYRSRQAPTVPGG